MNNYEVANELMDRRSANYSDRPVFPLFMKCAARAVPVPGAAPC